MFEIAVGFGLAVAIYVQLRTAYKLENNMRDALNKRKSARLSFTEMNKEGE